MQGYSIIKHNHGSGSCWQFRHVNLMSTKKIVMIKIVDSCSEFLRNKNIENSAL